MPSAEIQEITTSGLPYLLSIPTAPAEPDAGMPLLCFLHGYDEAAPADIRKGVTRHDPLKPQSSSLAREQFIIVAPQLPRGGDIWHRYADTVKEIVTHIRTEYQVDPQRMYLTGFSFGGNGVFDLALMQANTWAALWPVDPTCVPPRDVERPVWLSIGEVARRSTDGFRRTLDLEPAVGTPTADRLYLDEGEDHVGSATLAYRDNRIYQWLLSKTLP
jgi:hypothetical protein